MKGLFWLLASAALATLVALTLTDLYGNIVVFVPPYRVDMSLAGFALAMLLLFILLYAGLQFVRRILQVPELAAAYRERSKRARARAALAKSVVDLSAGRFSRALQGAQAAIGDDALTAAARLVAAQAAHKLNDTEKRDAYLQPLLDDAKPELREAAELTLAQAALDDHEPERAAETLARMTSGPARRVQALRLKLQASRQTGDTAEVLRITHLLEKHHDISADAANALGESAARELLNNARHDAERLGQAFSKLEPRWRKRPAVAIEAARLFASVAALPRAREALLDALAANENRKDNANHHANDNSSESSRLRQALAAHTHGIDTNFLSKVEQWRKAEPRDDALALLAGSACSELELWGKARQFLAQAADSANAPIAKTALVKLAVLEEQLGEGNKAAALFKRAALK